MDVCMYRCVYGCMDVSMCACDVVYICILFHAEMNLSETIILEVGSQQLIDFQKAVELQEIVFIQQKVELQQK